MTEKWRHRKKIRYAQIVTFQRMDELSPASLSLILLLRGVFKALN